MNKWRRAVNVSDRLRGTINDPQITLKAVRCVIYTLHHHSTALDASLLLREEMVGLAAEWAPSPLGRACEF